MNKKKILTGVLVVGFISIVIVSIVSISMFLISDEENTRTITDGLGRNVKVPEINDIDKIVAINAGSLRLLAYMNATDLVCGVEETEKTDVARPYNFAYPELASLPSIGPIFGGDPELIMAQNPDVIFTTYYTSVEEADTLTELTGIPVVVLNYGNLNDQINQFYGSLSIIGEVLGKKERAIFLINFFNETIADLNERTKDIPEEEKPWLYVGGIGYKGEHGMDSTETKYSPLAFINGRNSVYNVSTAEGTDHAFIQYGYIYKLQDWDMLDYLIVDAGGYTLSMADLKAPEKLGALDCVLADPPEVVMTLPYNWYTTNYGTVLIDAYYLGYRFFPEQFADLDYTEGNIYDQIYETLLGKGVYSDMADYYFGGFHNITSAEINA